MHFSCLTDPLNSINLLSYFNVSEQADGEIHISGMVNVGNWKNNSGILL